jgi:hypothetical protein
MTARLMDFAYLISLARKKLRARIRTAFQMEFATVEVPRRGKQHRAGDFNIYVVGTRQGVLCPGTPRIAFVLEDELFHVIWSLVSNSTDYGHKRALASWLNAMQSG